MILFDTEHTDLPTARGPMRTYLFRPQRAGRFPGLLLYSEIFQVTGPIRRLAAFFAGHGFVVAVPEVYHEFLPVGTVLAYDQAGADQGNALKFTKELASYDADVAALVEHLVGRADCTGSLGSFGVCLGGHLALRASFHARVRAAACFYPTDVHSATLGAGKHDDTLGRLGENRGAELLLVWGRQDPHVPAAGRRLIYDRLEETQRTFEWHEFNAAHAFLRDEGARYNPALAALGLGLAREFFDRTLR
ncbi:MAG: dienelactone hydrolase family protein [Verrucomicrobia bacterium]|nr:dienelactone hydrolase family protein [Verrucomicrobiota bacterium]